MEAWQIEEAIKRAEPGICQYLEIMELLPKVNVASDRDFQRRFNRFYRVLKRPPDWYEVYFSFMQQRKAAVPTFNETLDHLWIVLGRCEPSFYSKLVATLDPAQPIWDAFVLQNTGTKRPSYVSKNKLAEAKAAYQSIRTWYGQFLSSVDDKFVISVFNRKVREYALITDVKKLDFVLWQTRT
jgi:hypothetical protein